MSIVLNEVPGLKPDHSFYKLGFIFRLVTLLDEHLNVVIRKGGSRLVTVRFSNQFHGRPRNGACYWVTQALNSQCSGGLVESLKSTIGCCEHKLLTQS